MPLVFHWNWQPVARLTRICLLGCAAAWIVAGCHRPLAGPNAGRNPASAAKSLTVQSVNAIAVESVQSIDNDRTFFGRIVGSQQAPGRIIVASLPQEIARQMSAGHPAIAVQDGTAVECELIGLAAEESPPGSRQARFLLASEFQGSLTAGNNVARLVVPLPEQIAGNWIPLSSLNRIGNSRWSVFTLSNDEDGLPVGFARVRRQVVDVLRVENDRCLVAPFALAESPRVIVDGTHRVVEGQIVRVHEVGGGFGTGWTPRVSQ